MFERIMGVFLTGILIKLMDDYLDYDIDKEIDKWNFTTYLGTAILPYSLVILIISLYLNFKESVGFFAASYCLGMVNNNKSHLPSGLYAWQEGLLLIAISIYFTDIYNTIQCMILIITIQLIDDLIDYQSEKYINQHNYVLKYGYLNIIILFSIFILISLNYFFIKLLVFTIAVLLNYILVFILKYGWYDKNDN